MREAADEPIARSANARNNAMYQELRFERWAGVRDALWRLVDPLLADDARVAIIGGGSCDDVPLARIAARAACVDLVDFDSSSTDRALARVGTDSDSRASVRVLEEDVTGGCADMILHAVRDETPLPDALPLPHGPLGDGGYDLVIGDMLYTQLLHAGLIALDVFGERQHELMRRYDPHLTNALVRRIQTSLANGGHAVHVHDVACWASDHSQPIELEEALADPIWAFPRLLRHDNCDPHLVLGRMRANIRGSAWWEWPFEPNKRFLVRATVARADVGASAGGAISWG